MLEDLAIKLVDSGASTLRLTTLAATLIGFGGALLFNRRSPTELERIPYFALLLLLLILHLAVIFSFVLSINAAANGLLTALVAANLISLVVIGYFVGHLSLARSRNAFGTGKYAFLAPIPILNLILLLHSPKSEENSNHLAVNRRLRGAAGSILGIVLLAAYSVGLVAINNGASGRVAMRITTPENATAFLLESRGVEGTLKKMMRQANPTLPEQVDDVMRLAHLSAKGKRLQRTYVITLDNVTLTEEFARETKKVVCSVKGLVLLMRHGAVIEEVYKNRHGNLLGRFPVTHKACG